MVVNLDKLNARFVEKRKKKLAVAEKMGISIQALGKKLNGTTKITCEDAEIFIKELDITEYKDKVDIFLASPSQN